MYVYVLTRLCCLLYSLGPESTQWPGYLRLEGRTKMTNKQIRDIGLVGPPLCQSPGPNYRRGCLARHWCKASGVVRIIFHPSRSRFAMVSLFVAVIPQGVLWAKQAFKIV